MWLGFIAAEIILRCVEKNLQSCAGCRDGIFSPVLHMHYSLTLHQIIRKFMDATIASIDIDKIFQAYLDKFGPEIDGDELILLGKHFMQTLTPDALYYGNYVTANNDFAIHNKLETTSAAPIDPIYEPTPIKATKKPRVKRKKTTAEKDTSIRESI